MENEIVTQENQSLPVAANPYMGLIESALSNNRDLDVIEKMMDLQDRFEAKEALKAFNSAMSKFQSILPTIEKGGIVDFTSDKGRTYYTYAKLEDIAKSIQPALEETGLSYRFTQSQDASVVTVSCIVTHKLGHFEVSTLMSGKDKSGGKDELKSIASTLTYLRRYTLTGALGIVVGGEDFDAEPPGIEQGEQECYPDIEFNKNFPAWSKAIQGGKKTPDQMLTYLQKKGIVISQAQFEQLKQVEVK